MTSSSTLLRHIMGRLHSEFAMMDLGDLHHFLSISITRSSQGLFLSQRHTKLQDGSEYRSLAGALEYLTLTRPDLAYAVQQVCLFMHDPREPHMALIKRILRYVKGTLSSELHIITGSTQSLTAYSDANWAGCLDSRRSTSNFCVYLGDNLVS
nr:uncharacterized mitochondrial protein AtMg00810-like [Setaria viridis]